MYFAENLKTLRKKNHMTQKELARQMNLSRATIAGYEKKRRQPSYEILVKFAEIFHVSIDFLITGRETVYSVSDSGWGTVCSAR